MLCSVAVGVVLLGVVHRIHGSAVDSSNASESQSSECGFVNISSGQARNGMLLFLSFLVVFELEFMLLLFHSVLRDVDVYSYFLV